MSVLMFQPEEIDYIWRLLAAILHLGNVNFEAIQNDGVDGSQVDPQCENHLTRAAKLLQVGPLPP